MATTEPAASTLARMRVRQSGLDGAPGAPGRLQVSCLYAATGTIRLPERAPERSPVVALPAPVVALIREVYSLRQRGGVTDAEARWIMELVLPVYGITLADVARLVGGQTVEHAGEEAGDGDDGDAPCADLRDRG